MQDRDLCGSPEFHVVKVDVMVDFFKKEVEEYQEATGGGVLTSDQIIDRIFANEEAVRAINACRPHEDAHNGYRARIKTLRGCEAELAQVEPIEEVNVFARKRAKALRGNIRDYKENEGQAWQKVLYTNSAIHPHFQETHVRPADPGV